MNIDHLNIEPNRVLDTPDIIYLNEYPIVRSTIITPSIQRKFIPTYLNPGYSIHKYSIHEYFNPKNLEINL